MNTHFQRDTNSQWEFVGMEYNSTWKLDLKATKITWGWKLAEMVFNKFIFKKDNVFVSSSLGTRSSEYRLCNPDLSSQVYTFSM